MLDTLITLSLAATLLSLGLLLAKLLARPLGLAARLAANGLLGLAALCLTELLGRPFGLELGLNIVTASVSAALGLPGVALLLALRYLL